MAWRFACEPFLSRVWDGQMVVYDPCSGDTHCVDRLASAILAQLVEQGPLSVAELCQRVRQARLQGADSPDDDLLTTALGELEKLRLVRRIAA